MVGIEDYVILCLCYVCDIFEIEDFKEMESCLVVFAYVCVLVISSWGCGIFYFFFKLRVIKCFKINGKRVLCIE